MQTELLAQQELPMPKWDSIKNPNIKRQILLKAAFSSMQHPVDKPLTQEELIYAFASLPQMSDRPLLQIKSLADTAHHSTPSIRVVQVRALVGTQSHERYGYQVEVTLALDRRDGQVMPMTSVKVVGIVPNDQLVWRMHSSV